MKFDVFVSYCVQDGREYAECVKTVLSTSYFLKCYVSTQDSITGGELDEQIRETIKQVKTVIVIFTRKALSSHWVLGEISYARSLKKEVICYREDDVNHDELPLNLQNLLTEEFESVEDLSIRLKKVDRWGIPVIIPAAGQSSGIAPFDSGMPKILLPIGGKPILHHILSALELGADVFSSVIILSGQFYNELEYYSRIYQGNLPICCIETPAPTLAGALKSLNPTTSFLVYFSDILLEEPVDWRQMLWQHREFNRQYSAMGTLLASRDYPLPVGRIIPASTGAGLVGSFSEKPQTLLADLANMAIALFEPTFLQYVEPSDNSLFGQSVPRAMVNGTKFGYFTHGKWRHIQTLTDWLAARQSYDIPPNTSNDK